MLATEYKATSAGVTVRLEWYELQQAAIVGINRRIKALHAGGKETHGFDGDRAWTVDIEGAAGELAVAKVLGVYWSGSINTFKFGADVGHLQVRTMGKEHYGLLIRPNDDDAAIFVLVVGRAPQFRVVGFIRGIDAKKQEWFQSFGNGRPAAYFVPQDRLEPIENLMPV